MIKSISINVGIFILTELRVCERVFECVLFVFMCVFVCILKVLVCVLSIWVIFRYFQGYLDNTFTAFDSKMKNKVIKL